MPLTLNNEADLIQSLYGALTDPEGFHPFLEKLANACNATASQLMVIHKQPLRIDHLWHHGLSREFIDWYLENNMIAQDVVTQHAVQQNPGLFQSALPLLPDFNPGTDYSKWQNEQDMLDSAWLVVDHTASHIYLLCLQRTVAQGPYRQPELDALNRLVPYIQQTVQLCRQMETRSKAALSLPAVIDILPDATFVLDNQASITCANRPARDLVAREHCIGIHNDRFIFAEKNIQAAFFSTSVQVVRSSMGKEDYCSETLFLKRPGRPPLVFVIRPVESSELLTGGALVTVYEPDKRPLPEAGQIADYFDLTPAEARVCEFLTAGLDVQAIADKLDRSVATVRSQIKQAFLKTGCSRQGELISRILSTLLR